MNNKNKKVTKKNKNSPLYEIGKNPQMTEQERAATQFSAVALKKLETVFDNLREGHTITQACLFSDLSRAAYYQIMKARPDLRRVQDSILELRCQIVEDSLFKNAVDGNVKAQVFWLKNRKKERWKDRIEYEDENYDTISEKDMKRDIRRLLSNNKDILEDIESEPDEKDKNTWS